MKRLLTIAFLVAALFLPASATISFVQSMSNKASSCATPCSSVNLAFGSNITAHNAIIGCIDNLTAGGTISSVAMTGETIAFFSNVNPVTQSPTNTYCFYDLNAAGGNKQFTITMSGTQTLEMQAIEVSSSNGSPFTVDNNGVSNTYTSGATYTTSSGITPGSSSKNDIIFAMVRSNGGPTTCSWSGTTTSVSCFTGNANSNSDAYVITSSTSTVTPSNVTNASGTSVASIVAGALAEPAAAAGAATMPAVVY